MARLGRDITGNGSDEQRKVLEHLRGLHLELLDNKAADPQPA